MITSSLTRGSSDYTRYANIGGPMSRTKKERISSSVLGNDDGAIHCPRVIRLGIDFGGRSPLESLETLLSEEGFSSPEDLRNEFIIPQGRLICRPLPESVSRMPFDKSPPFDILEQALLLGLCTAQIFDPERPVIWTETSITRGLELFDPAGFYA